MGLQLQIPFYESWPTATTDGIHCIEMSLKMILEYFEPDKTYSLKELEAITNKKPEKGSWEMPYSLWLANHGYDLRHYSTFDYVAFRDEGVAYIRRAYGDEVAEWQLKNSELDQARTMVDDYLRRATVVTRKPKIQDIIDAMNNGYVVRAAVDAGYIDNSGKYEGHSVVVVGYDDQNIYFHDPGPPGVANRVLPHAEFQIALDKFGGEMDVIKPKAQHLLAI